jgi:hypothetical protein
MSKIYRSELIYGIRINETPENESFHKQLATNYAKQDNNLFEKYYGS